MKKLILIGLTVVMTIMFSSVAMAQPAAPDGNVLNGCYQKINGQLRIVSSPSQCNPSEISVSWNIVGPQGLAGSQGPPGPQGPAGPEGPAGPQGSEGTGTSGVVEAYTLSGSIGSISSRSSQWVFAGPTVNVSTSDSQRITAVAQAPLGTRAEGLAYFGYDLCYRSAGSLDALTNLAGINNSVGQVSGLSGRVSFAAAASWVPGTGTWEVGYCILNSGFTALNNNDLISGWVVVTN